jgi:hypothetical protein
MCKIVIQDVRRPLLASQVAADQCMLRSTGRSALPRRVCGRMEGQLRRPGGRSQGVEDIH